MRVKPKAGSILTGLFILGTVFSVTGCRSVEPVTRSSQPTELSREHADLARSLALFSMGYSAELYRDTDSALEYYKHAIADDPANISLYSRAGRLFLQRREYAEAVELMSQLVEHRPDSEEAHMMLALAYRANREPERAEAIYERLIKKQRSADAYMELATMFLKDGREDEAVSLLERGAKEVQDASELLQVLGELYSQRAGRSETEQEAATNRKAAINCLERALTLSPQDPLLLTQIGDLYYEEGQLEDAIGIYKKLESVLPEDARVKQKLALALVAGGQQKEAIEALERLAHQQPTNSKIFYHLGELYHKLGDLERALKNFELSAKAANPDPATFLKLALLYMETDQDRAVEVLESARNEFPADARFTEMLAHVYLNRKEYRKAADYYALARETIMDESPEQITPTFDFYAAIATQLAGDTEEATKLLTLAVKDTPPLLDAYVQFVLQDPQLNDPDTIRSILTDVQNTVTDLPSLPMYIGLFHTFVKDFESAIEKFAEADALDEALPPENRMLGATFYFWFASACERTGDLERADELFRRCLEIDDRYSEAYNYIAYMWAEKGLRLEESIEYVKKALEIQPDSAAYIDTLGWIYYMQEDYDAAYIEIRRAADIMPEDPTIAEHMGDVLMKRGENTEGLAWWKKALTVNPDNESLAGKLRDHDVDVEELLATADAPPPDAASPSDLESIEEALPTLDREEGESTNPVNEEVEAAPTPEEPQLLP